MLVQIIDVYDRRHYVDSDDLAFDTSGPIFCRSMENALSWKGTEGESKAWRESP